MTNPRHPDLRLILFRHAKAEQAAGRGEDFERRLAPRGRRDALRVAEALAALGVAPDLVLCSAAARTRETWAQARVAFEAALNVQMRRDLYLADRETILAVIHEAGGTCRTLMVIGHNPGLQDLAMRLAGSGIPALRQKLAEKFPTAAAAMIVFEAESWAAIRPSSGRLVHLLAPRLLTPGHLAGNGGGH